jgi:hypothetical protein
VKKAIFSEEDCKLNKDYEMMKSIILGNEYFAGDNLDLNGTQRKEPPNIIFRLVQWC